MKAKLLLNLKLFLSLLVITAMTLVQTQYAKSYDLQYTGDSLVCPFLYPHIWTTGSDNWSYLPPFYPIPYYVYYYCLFDNGEYTHLWSRGTGYPLEIPCPVNDDIGIQHVFTVSVVFKWEFVAPPYVQDPNPQFPYNWLGGSVTFYAFLPTAYTLSSDLPNNPATFTLEGSDLNVNYTLQDNMGDISTQGGYGGYLYWSNIPVTPGFGYLVQMTDVATGCKRPSNPISARISDFGDNINNTGFSIKAVPNPVLESATIDYTIAEPEYVSINLYNQVGEKVIELESRERKAGSYSFSFKNDNISAGVYNLILQAGTNTCMTKVVIIK
jgi:hypothetical protein